MKKPVYNQYVMDILGGITANLQNLMILADYTKRLIGDFEFSVCVAGRAQFPICSQSLLLGGNCRIGLEDYLFLEKDKMAKSNAEQVEKKLSVLPVNWESIRQRQMRLRISLD